LVAIGSNISALWILVANSFMQEPTGYAVVDGRAVMVSFTVLILNTNVGVQFPHTVFAGFVTAAFFVCLLSYTRLDCEVESIYNLQSAYEQEDGADNYFPPVAVTYWSFRMMKSQP